MQSWRNKANIYFFAWCIYCFQEVILPKGSLLTQLLLILLLIFSFYYAFIANTRYKLPVYFKGLNLLICMFFVYGTYLMIGGYNSAEYAKQVDSFSYLKGILISLLPIYPFYIFSKEGLINKKIISIYFVFLFTLAIASFFKNYQQQLYLAMLAGSNAEEFTNNKGYVFVWLIPFCVFFYKKLLLQYASLVLCLLFIFMSMKRGAIVVGVLCVVWLIWNNLKNVSFKKKIGVIAISIVLCIAGSLYVEWRMQESRYFQKRVDNTLEGNSSGRDMLYARFADYYWSETTPLQFVFGGGANATLKVGENYAHNDWLEIAVNQGLLGIAVYVIYWFLFIKTVFSNKFGVNEKLVLQLFFLISFLRTFFSMSYGSMGFIPMLALGYCLSKENENE